MRIFRTVLSVVAAAVALVACGDDVEGGATSVANPDEMVEVGFSVPMSVSRTAIADDGTTAYWMPGDKVALWAEDSAGNYVVEGTPFSMRHYSADYDRAFFTAIIPAMAEDNYRYTMCSPLPDAVNGTQVTYTVSAEQTGLYDGEHDIMLATPAEAGPLTVAGTAFDVVMRHKMHAVRIDIPEGRNLFGYRFTSLEITFPAPVVGDVTFDVTDPNAEPIYSNLTNVITVNNPDGFDEGDTIWVFVLPGTVDGNISYRVRTANRRSEVVSYYLARNMRGGHVTPIQMATPALDLYTAFHFSIGENYLGEDFNSFTIYDHNNTVLGTFQRNDANDYVLEYYGDIDLSAYQNRDFTLSFDSTHAIVTNTLNVGTLTPYTVHIMPSVNVPYLFEESFSDVSPFSDGHDNPANGFNGDSKNYSSWFSNYTSHSRMIGWSGGRYGCSSGSLRMCCRSETGLGAISNYRGRVDTPPMSKLKSGVTATLRVQFTYSAATNFYLLSSGNTRLNFGWTNSTGVIGPATNISNLVIDKQVVGDATGSYTNVNTLADVTFSGASNATRLSWMSDTDAEGAFAGNANFWLYIDNIKVQVLP